MRHIIELKHMFSGIRCQIYQLISDQLRFYASDKMLLPHRRDDVYKACESFLRLSKHGECSGEEGNPLAAEVQGPAFSRHQHQQRL